MSSCIEGKGINFIRHNGGLVAGQSESIEIHTCCDVITVTKPEDVDLIINILKEGYSMRKRIPDLNVMNYLEYTLTEEYGW